MRWKTKTVDCPGKKEEKVSSISKCCGDTYLPYSYFIGFCIMKVTDDPEKSHLGGIVGVKP